ncbi:FtsB family cell division protein [Anaerolentibacter hominis]|uniref:FtsB family cell division protein n=1 Tax=Anaerolentibacter hominis TaxID=3079009 RepID=UPI0031B81B41
MVRKKKIRKRRIGLWITSFVVLILCCFATYKRINLENERKTYEDQIAALEKQKADLEKESEEIKEYGAYVQTKKYVEEVARDKLGLVYEDEIIFEGGEGEE